MTEKETQSFSKLLSLILRHKPETVGITLDANGWIAVEQLLEALEKAGKSIDMAALNYIVATNNKKRFAFNETGTHIRASQGHSVSIELGYEPQEPPEILYHGTAEKNTASILSRGLIKGKRNHVHLSSNTATAIQVGQRHGKPVIFTIRAKEMHIVGFQFYISENNVWLTDYVPAEYLIL